MIKRIGKMNISNSSTIEIVMAIYKPNHYIIEQLNSIINQTYYSRISRIIIVNDSPTIDDTIYQKIISFEKVDYFVNESGFHGAKNNFSHGLSLTKSEYVMLCDQDDVWLPRKIEATLNEALLKDEGRPLLVCTDVRIVDDKLNLLQDSMFALRSYPFDKLGVYRGKPLYRNISPGCTMLVNRALLDISLPIPAAALMHDWWLVSLASLKGNISILNVPTMLYRQHSNNAIGAGNLGERNNSLKSFVSRFVLFVRFKLLWTRQFAKVLLWCKNDN
ncbi:hypothetical protein VIN01S_31590 [Vibrio inusitatus NBRC 102082]|uniref:Glycosyltransferase 2-like domain-containing protein n=1 Tax=Vibrio inusitatus NBRC 102082 TaxID=1219070 RepID=A0A4Y3HZ82_9VIBR|nr:glycosyltransferase family 2 protein [Vibrio inusitatus]GEA52355.1 hypothetical protein VIN01S_31590 [Vibrio inusitatus NBRC 102082]